MIYETIFPHIKFYLIFSFLLVKILQPFLRFSNFPLLWSRAPLCHQLDYRTSSFCYFIQQYQVHTQSWWEKCTHQLCFVNCIINACVKWCNNSLKRRHISSQRQKEFYLRRKWLLEFFSKSHTVMFIIIPDVSLFLIFSRRATSWRMWIDGFDAKTSLQPDNGHPRGPWGRCLWGSD